MSEMNPLLELALELEDLLSNDNAEQDDCLALATELREMIEVCSDLSEDDDEEDFA